MTALEIPTGPAYIYRAQLFRVIDGDSWELSVDAGFRVSIRLMCRLQGYSCPELREAGGTEAALAAAALLAGRQLLVRSYKDRQTFARWVADVWVLAETWQSVGELLVAQGHARRN